MYFRRYTWDHLLGELADVEQSTNHSYHVHHEDLGDEQLEGETEREGIHSIAISYQCYLVSVCYTLPIMGVQLFFFFSG